MEESPKTEIKKVCQYCHSYIKSKEDMLVCPKCSAVYHIDCWYENEGCASYGCDYKLSTSTKKTVRHFSVGDALTEAEYYLNCRKYFESLALCRQIIQADADNIEAKKIYNKMTEILNAKNNLIRRGDISYDEGDLKNAKKFYEEALSYTDETESEILKSKLKIIEERYSLYLKRKKKIRYSVNAVLLAIVIVLAGLVYYTLFLREAREYNEIERNSSGYEDSETIEKMISGYEQFLVKYKDDKYYTKAKQQINRLSSSLAEAYLPLDYRDAYKFFIKIDTSVDNTEYSELRSKMQARFRFEFKEQFDKAKQYNRSGEYVSAKECLDKVKGLIELSPQFATESDRNKVNNAINLMNKKSSSLTKLKSVNDEIKSKTDELDELLGISNEKVYNISLQIKQKKSDGLYIAEDINSKETIAVISGEEYSSGEYDNAVCIKRGNMLYEKTDGKQIKIGKYEIINKSKAIYYEETYIKSQKEMLAERISNLRIQRAALDSVLKISF